MNPNLIIGYIKLFDKTFSFKMNFVNFMQFVIHANKGYTLSKVVVILMLLMIYLLVASEESKIIPFC